jgi:hypothetical protein
MSGIGRNSRPQNQGIGNLAQGTAKLPLSSSISGVSNGNPVLVLNSSTGAGYIEAHNFSLGVIEELYLWCSNRTSSNALLTMSFGDNTFSGENIIVSMTAQQGLSLVYPGVPHQGNVAGTQKLYLRASAANTLNISGFVIRSYPFGGKNASSYGYFNQDVNQ